MNNTATPEVKKATELVVGDRYVMSNADVERPEAVREVVQLSRYTSPSDKVERLRVEQKDRHGWHTLRLIDLDRLLVIVPAPRPAVSAHALDAAIFPDGIFAR